MVRRQPALQISRLVLCLLVPRERNERLEEFTTISTEQPPPIFLGEQLLSRYDQNSAALKNLQMGNAVLFVGEITRYFLRKLCGRFVEGHRIKVRD